MRRGPLLAAGVAALASLPGLRFPFLSDDWAQIDAVGVGLPLRTPFADFRPLFMASLWIERRLVGVSPSLQHLTNLILIAACAALVAIAARRYTGDARLGAVAGLLFALHPYHVENAAWIAARSDPLFALPYLLAALAYDRWRARRRGFPLLAMALFEAALLAKEPAVTLPIVLVAVGLIDRSRRPGADEWARGLAPLMALALAHFLILRPWVLGGPGRTLLAGFGAGWIKSALGYTAAAIVPADAELLAARPALWGCLAAVAALSLMAAARWRSDRIPGASLAAAAVFAILLVPALVGFQERHLFLPTAASSVALAAALGALRGRWATIAVGVLAAAWIAGSVAQWAGWGQAAIAGRRLEGDLARAASRPGVREIVIANLPFEVGGGSVAGDFRAALEVSGLRPVTVRAVAYVSYPSAAADSLDGPAGTAVRRPPPFAEVWLRIAEGPFSHFVGPGRGRRDRLETSAGTLLFDGSGGVRVRIDPAPGRTAYAWIGGGLQPLF
jgi:hypothetical protein